MVCFEQLSGMKINYNKSNLMPMNLDEDETMGYAKIFCCKVGSFPFKYLGVPLYYEKFRREDIQPVVDKILNRIPGWKGRLLSYGARLVLLRACLASIPIYLMSLIRFPKWAIESINSHMANFFWDDTGDKHKYHLSNWHSLAQRKENGGLGIPDLRDLNLCLLSSWVQRYYNLGSKMWKCIVDFKYHLDSPNLFCCENSQASPFWKGVLWAAKAAKMGYRWKIGNGKRVRFWEDLWFGSCSLAIQYWEIYSIINEQGCSVCDAWDGSQLRFSFRRTVDDRLMQLWYELVQIANDIQFTNESDAIIWQFNSSGRYSVQSLYAVVNDRGMRQVFTPVMWKIGVPPRLHIFLWLLANDKILTRNNLAKRRHVYFVLT
jgi:hypothetical protein